MQNPLKWLPNLIPLVLCACAAAPRTTMVVPSEGTERQLEQISREAGMHVEALTVRRDLKWFRIEGGQEGHLVGKQDSDGTTVDIPIPELALVYYARSSRLDKGAFPLLEPLTSKDGARDCADLALDLKRAAAIRWYARALGAAPFDTRGAVAEHVKSALGSITIAALRVFDIGTIGRLGLPQPGPPDITATDLRWTVTRSDIRIAELLRLRATKACEPIEFGASRISEAALLDQLVALANSTAEPSAPAGADVAKQTLLLDQMYGEGGVVPGDLPDPPVRDFSDWNLPIVNWNANDHIEAFSYTLGLSGNLHFDADRMTFRGTTLLGKAPPVELQIPYYSIKEVTIGDLLRSRAIVLHYRDGHQDLVRIYDTHERLDQDMTWDVFHWLRTRVRESKAPCGSFRVLRIGAH